ncbi:MAG: phenylalanine--tRNA ligase subunit alpha [Candidatus Gracilibacteria bacterium]|nr:phenylalanine--tRNA ligase subunit alpha [Candidatus Gracilibacteria bacterium]
MKNEIEKIEQEAIADTSACKSIEELKEVEIKFLGRKGLLPMLLRKIPELSSEDKKTVGQMGNVLRKNLEEKIANRYFELEDQQEENEFFDITIPAKPLEKGHHHPISMMICHIEEVFSRLGFTSISGAEIDDDWHNFSALNVPKDHPAREMQDTFWVKNIDDHVLRTQTSNMQIHYMEANKPPIRIIAPGKTFRKDSDATHSPMFHQFEGLMVDKNVSLANLKWVLKTALSEILEKEVELRFRLSFFPFTEPSLEVDASCVQCAGKNPNCKVCKGTGFLEIAGAGMVHPNVLRNAGLDPEKWNGFAFGCGIERILMVKYQIDDLRLFYENDLRFLEQF